MATTFYSTVLEDDCVSMQFTDRPISRGIFNRFSRACQNHITFGEIDAEQLRALMKIARVDLVGEIDRTSQTSGARQGLDIFQAQSIRRHIIRQYNITSTHRVDDNIEKIAEQYQGGKKILEISEERKLSPYIIFRKLMEHLHGSDIREKINIVSLEKARAEDILSARDASEYMSVREFDFESVSVQLRMAAMANARENNFVAFLRDDLGVKLKTQVQLYEEAARDGIQPVTPDALFLSPVEINGTRAHWIDFKSYCGTPIQFLAKSAKAQHDKYVRKFGPGFMVYEHGFVESLPYRAVSARALRDIIEKGIQRGVLL